ncbi:hypothetical protein CSC80_05130 [Maribacter sp. 6B07]|uniref:hypothetical protein n=1 Tax=Maribacter sp. 6B07 TaxID=2045442 RepID=UPI000C081CD7|nr:hypothetical protein [Maribacter sp. 6B07]PHN94732.1 hypothetical protein CSC80_05130 [Maribacter sp. 6B07]
MVKVIDYETRLNDLGEGFNVLIVQGGLTPVVSKETGKTYLTVKKASLPCTFDEDTCKEIIGESLEGEILKVECEPFSYINKETGDTITMSYRYEFINKELMLQNEHMVEGEMIS